MKHLKRLSGIGKVFHGEQLLGEANYVLDVYQDVERIRLSEGIAEVPGLGQIRGRIRPAFPLAGKLTLVTDAQTFPFSVTDYQGNITVSGTPVDRSGAALQIGDL